MNKFLVPEVHALMVDTQTGTPQILMFGTVLGFSEKLSFIPSSSFLWSQELFDLLRVLALPFQASPKHQMRSSPGNIRL